MGKRRQRSKSGELVDPTQLRQRAAASRSHVKELAGEGLEAMLLALPDELQLVIRGILSEGGNLEGVLSAEEAIGDVVGRKPMRILRARLVPGQRDEDDELFFPLLARGMSSSQFISAVSETVVDMAQALSLMQRMYLLCEVRSATKASSPSKGAAKKRSACERVAEQRGQGEMPRAPTSGIGAALFEADPSMHLRCSRPDPNGACFFGIFSQMPELLVLVLSFLRGVRLERARAFLLVDRSTRAALTERAGVFHEFWEGVYASTFPREPLPEVGAGKTMFDLLRKRNRYSCIDCGAFTKYVHTLWQQPVKQRKSTRSGRKRVCEACEKALPKYNLIRLDLAVVEYAISSTDLLRECPAFSQNGEVMLLLRSDCQAMALRWHRGEHGIRSVRAIADKYRQQGHDANSSAIFACRKHSSNAGASRIAEQPSQSLSSIESTSDSEAASPSSFGGSPMSPRPRHAVPGKQKRRGPKNKDRRRALTAHERQRVAVTERQQRWDVNSDPCCFGFSALVLSDE
mmetsp:Transcript_8887/g.33547  ORF Transcript_8887/g.33547 Transcript_8887/m.33547 type:complete len:517 (-) Transcript_8887:155-1705(-)